MTISISEQTEKRFRKAVKNELGSGKGKLGRAADEAFTKWVDEKEQRTISKRMLEILDKGFDMGKIQYKHRNELHDRREHNP